MHPIHPSFPPWCPYVHSLYLCLYFRFAFLKGHRLLIFLVDIFILKISIKKKRYLSYQLDKDCLQSVPLTSVIFQPLCFDFIIIFQKVNLFFEARNGTSTTQTLQRGTFLCGVHYFTQVSRTPRQTLPSPFHR